jgi:hypothetical protein
MKKRIPTLDEYIAESQQILEGKISFENILKYFPNPKNPAEYLHDKIHDDKYTKNKTPLSEFINDICNDLNVTDPDDIKTFKSAIKNYVENLDTVRFMKSRLIMNESDPMNEKKEYSENLGDFIISIKNITKDGNDIITDCEIIFDDKNDVQPFLDNDLDNVNMAILDFAEEKKIIKNDEYSVGFDKDLPLTIKRNKITGKLVFWSAS